MGLFQTAVKYAAGAALFTLSLLPSAFSQETTTPEFSKKSFEYQVGKVTYNVMIAGFDDYTKVKDVPHALEIVKNNDSPSILLAGDVTPKELSRIKEVLSRLHVINPKTISHLEPIVLSMKEGSASAAISNAVHEDKLDDYLKKYVGTDFEDTHEDQDYVAKADSWYGGLIVVPKSEEEFEKTLDKIGERYAEPEDKLDFLLFGIKNENLEHGFAHEWGHLLATETGSLRKLLYTEIGEASDLDASRSMHFDLSGFGDMYINRRKKEVAKWVTKKMVDLEEAILYHKKSGDLAKKQIARKILEKPDHKDALFKQDVFEAVDLLGADRLRKMYREILVTASRDLYIGERIAEDFADVITNNAHFTSTARFFPLFGEKAKQDLEKLDKIEREEKDEEVLKSLQTEREELIKMLRKAIGYEHTLVHESLQKFEDTDLEK